MWIKFKHSKLNISKCYVKKIKADNSMAAWGLCTVVDCF